MTKKIAIIGLGFVGLSLAVVLASKGYRVLGIDSNKDKISKIQGGDPTFYEPKLSSFLQKALKKTSFQISSKIEKAVNDCNVIFITVGTPLSKKNKIDLRYIKSVVKEIGKCLLNSTNQPLIVVKSTVIPNTTKNIILPILEINSKKKDGEGFTIVTNPEFLREGKAIEDTIKPHVIIIGGEKSNSINILKKLYQSFYKKNIPYIITNFETAEMIKYANNSFLATKISFINQIAMICQSIPNTNIDDVAKAIGIDPRIGNQFLNAGPGYGGSCLPKDVQALISFSVKQGQKLPLLEAVQEVNHDQVRKIIALLKKILTDLKGKRIAILGLSFKEDSDDIRESVSIRLIELLLKKNAKIVAHDPMAIENTRRIFNDKIDYSDDIKTVLEKSDCAIIMTGWRQYNNLNNNSFKKMKKKNLIDTRRILQKKKLDVKYYAVGIGQNIK